MVAATRIEKIGAISSSAARAAREAIAARSIIVATAAIEVAESNTNKATATIAKLSLARATRATGEAIAAKVEQKSAEARVLEYLREPTEIGISKGVTYPVVEHSLLLVSKEAARLKTLAASNSVSKAGIVASTRETIDNGYEVKSAIAEVSAAEFAVREAAIMEIEACAAITVAEKEAKAFIKNKTKATVVIAVHAIAKVALQEALRTSHEAYEAMLVAERVQTGRSAAKIFAEKLIAKIAAVASREASRDANQAKQNFKNLQMEILKDAQAEHVLPIEKITGNRVNESSYQRAYIGLLGLGIYKANTSAVLLAQDKKQVQELSFKAEEKLAKAKAAGNLIQSLTPSLVQVKIVVLANSIKAWLILLIKKILNFFVNIKYMMKSVSVKLYKECRRYKTFAFREVDCGHYHKQIELPGNPA